MAKLILFVAGWEIAYYFFLKDIRIPDKFLTDVLSLGIVKVLNLISNGYTSVPNGAGSLIMHGNNVVINIADSCNGLGMMVIYLSVIIFLPYSFKRKALFSIAGIIILIIADIIRCLALIWIYHKYHSWFDFNHHYVFSLLMFLLIFYGWVLYVKKPKVNAAS